MTTRLTQLSNMMVYVAHTKCIQTKYKTVFLSRTTLYLLVSALVTFIVPYFIAYNGGDFWVKQVTFYEQPSVQFTGGYLVEVVTSNLSHPIVCTTFPGYYTEASYYDQCSLIKARESDEDFDGKADNLYFSTLINLPAYTEVLFLNLMLSLDYRLKRTCPLRMQSAVIFQKSLHSAISAVNVFGDLQFQQTTPVHCIHRREDTTYNYAVGGQNSESTNFFHDILVEYVKRNFSTHLTNSYTTVETLKEQTFEVSLNVRFPQQKFFYKASFWQILKWAWIQYFAIYIIVAWFVKQLSNYLFDNRLLLFYKQKQIKDD